MHRIIRPFASSEEFADLAWTQDVGEGEILAEVLWGACEVCTFHMGDEQWEDIETEMNIAFDENYMSDDDYIPDAAVSMPSTGREIVCQGACGGKFWSHSGTSSHCIGCRD